jgi:amino acid adenylation domain-containing protein
VEGLIGFFVNTLVLRTRIDATMSFREQLQQVREVCLGAYAHQDVPFEMVVEELQPERDTSRSPLFQVMFVMQNAPQGKLEMPAGLKLEPLEVELEATKFELTLMVMETEAGLVGQCSYRTELFEETTIARMLDHWQVLLDAAVADPEARVMALPYLTEREQHMLLEGWNETSRDYPREECVHELFERQAALTPEALAVVFEGERLSYVELNLRAERLARRLRALGVGPETFVGLLTERTPRMLIGLLAILKAGGAYVPLEPSWPKERLALMLADACTPVLLTEERFANALPDCNARVVLLDAVEEGRDVLIEDLNAPHARPKNPAYVIYTSGSTGTPKGVVVEHRQIVNYVRAVAERVRLEPGMSYAMVQPLTVDSSQSVIFPTFFVGGTIHLISRERATHPVALAEYFDREPVDCLKIAPSHLAALQTATRPERLMPRRRLLIGGEGSRREWAEGLARLAPHCAVFNHYGPTEATVGMLTYRVHANEELGPTHFLPTGLPLANTKAYVLDRYMRPVAVGVSGELYIGGDCVARGYLNRPGTTAEKFVPDPYSSEPGARLYKTGDVVRRLADGNILFIGRDDHQVKIRGFRIELGEIEAALTRHVRVGRAVVIAREEARGDRRLVGYVVPSEPGETEGLCEELREDLRKKLPDYMVPSALVVLDSLPLSAHGKLDVRRLPAPDAALVQPEGYVAPRTPEEELLAGIWGEVLGTERISVQDNFFERGGHSLLATQVISRVQALFGIDLPLRAMFETATLAELAQLIVDQRQAEGFIETENLLAELEALSEEEAQSLVAGYGAQL